MTTIYQTKIGVIGPRSQGSRVEATIIIGGVEYAEDEIDASPETKRTNAQSEIDWDGVNEVTVNRTDLNKCR